RMIRHIFSASFFNWVSARIKSAAASAKLSEADNFRSDMFRAIKATVSHRPLRNPRHASASWAISTKIAIARSAYLADPARVFLVYFSALLSAEKYVIFGLR